MTGAGREKKRNFCLFAYTSRQSFTCGRKKVTTDRQTEELERKKRSSFSFLSFFLSRLWLVVADGCITFE